ncbi:MAG TPA: saccharopine dehydrogenase C-terminal domain-containing protein [Flavitalea sp.]|nr:saccharopine dehydrogenase C-terminal domain-containing protein [Flavitalea sp.]
MKHIVLFGAGKSSTFLIEYLVAQLSRYNWKLTVLDADQHAALQKIGVADNAFAVELHAENEEERDEYIQSADIVISLLPPALHYYIALACLQYNKHLLTASYVDRNMEAMRDKINEKRLLFLCEMGLDPGIDHMSAMELIHTLQNENAVITSFRSHCGGLVAPESDDNPWHHKISWNPKNIVLAGKTGAHYRENDYEKVLLYEELFNSSRIVNVPGAGDFSWYPNRDSLAYIDIYNLNTTHNFVRTTLRYPEFCFGWKNIIQLKLTDETPDYDTNGMSLRTFFQLHLNKHGFSEWIETHLTSRFVQTKNLLEKLQQIVNAEEKVDEEQMKELREFMMVDDAGKLQDINLEEVKTQAAATVAGQMHEANLSIKQLFYLGMDDNKTIINQGKCSAADVLRFAIENKLALRPNDRDLVVMMHEIEYEINNERHSINSTLILKGENGVRTAMAKTVGLPLAIAAKLILLGKINVTGLHIPVIPEIYKPVLKELKEYGIFFNH